LANYKIFGVKRIIIHFFLLFLQQIKPKMMANKDLNRLKVVLAEKKRTNKWLAEQLGKDQGTISKWCTNTCQPDLGNLMRISELLEVDLNELVRFEKR
jgi:DNA-binding Xre family transcriptional regulator